MFIARVGMTAAMKKTLAKLWCCFEAGKVDKFKHKTRA
jgi:hypothetical protein